MERLPDSELEVMLALWSADEPLKTSAILERVKKEWTMSTIQALLSRLEERGFVKMEKKMRFKYYSPAIDEKVYRDSETKSFLERLHNNSYKSLLASLVSTKSISEKDIKDIEDIIKRGAKQ